MASPAPLGATLSYLNWVRTAPSPAAVAAGDCILISLYQARQAHINELYRLRKARQEVAGPGTQEEWDAYTASMRAIVVVLHNIYLSLIALEQPAPVPTVAMETKQGGVKQPVAKACVLGALVPAMLDTGSMITTVHEGLLEKLGLAHHPRRPAQGVNTAGGARSAFSGKLRMPIAMGGITVVVDAYVTGGDMVELLVGMDWLMEVKPIIDLGRRVALMPNMRLVALG